jgi:hypothetical protein
MLGWFNANRVDHPLADARESRRIVADLPRDTFKAMGEIAFWLESINATPGFRLDRRFELTDQLDVAARSHLRKLAQDYLQVRQQKFQESRLWSALTEFWRLTGAAYGLCIEGYQADAAGAAAIRPRLPLIVRRALHARAERLKWLLLRYGPIDAGLWGDLGALYAFAESKQIAAAEVALYEGGAASSPARELLAALMFAAASTESLLPEQIDLAQRSVAFFAPRFVLAATPAPGCTHAFDCAMRQPPQRLRGGAQDPSVRYFGAGDACDEIARLLRVLAAEGALPSDVAMGDTAEPPAIEAVWRHLLQYWGSEPPERRAERQAATVRLTVVPGFAPLMAALEEPRAGAPGFVERRGSEPVESWVAENASDGGYGARVPATAGDWLGVGALIGIQAEGRSRWGTGVVRRMLHTDQQDCRVGIELLGHHAIAVRLAPSGVVSSFNATRDNDPAILLTPKPDADRHVRLLLRASTYTEGQALEIRVRGQVHEMRPVRLVESTVDYDLAVFEVVGRIA